MAVIAYPTSVAGVGSYAQQPATKTSGLDNVVQFLARMSPNGTGGLGEPVSTITVVVQNRNRVPQQTFGPATLLTGAPAWIVPQVNTPADTAYLLNLVLDPATYSYPGDFVMLHVSAVAVSGNTYELDFIAPFSSGAGFTAPAGREPYADLSFAHEFFFSRLEGTFWEQAPEREQLKCLITASDDLDKEVYKGVRLAASEPASSSGTVARWAYRQFPRYMEEFSFPDFYAGGIADGIPHRMKAACCIQALFLWQQFSVRLDPNTRRSLQGFAVTGFTAQGSAETFDLNRQSETRLCQAARDEIRPLVATAVRYGYFN